MASENVDAQEPLSVAERARELYSAQKWAESRELLLQHSDTRDPELLWQLIRIHYRIGKHDTNDKAEQQRLAQTAEIYLNRAMEKGVGTEHFLCQKVRKMHVRYIVYLYITLFFPLRKYTWIYHTPCTHTCPHAHTQWTAISLSWISELKGQKEKILKSFEVREHIEVVVSAHFRHQ